MNNENARTMLRVENLEKRFLVQGSLFPSKRKYLTAVGGVSFNIEKGKTFGLVGESGCGKSTVARCIMRLHDVDGGHIFFENTDIAYLNEDKITPYRQKIQMIFQDPYMSLDPKMTVHRIIGEPIGVHYSGLSGKERTNMTLETLEKVGLGKRDLDRYPHEFSGGQRQRIGIARALVSNPSLILCDEPIAALDVSIQAQVVNVLQQLQEDIGLTYLFIAHDLAMVKYISDSVGVMYLGQFVEMAQSDELYAHPLHPYTKGLMDAIPIANPFIAKNEREIIQGEISSPMNAPSGCPFRTRCKYATKRCAEGKPTMREAAPGHFVACYLYA